MNREQARDFMSHGVDGCIDENCKVCEATNFILDREQKLTEKCERLEKDIQERKAQRIAYASEFNGDEGAIHQGIRNLKTKIAQLEKEKATGAEFARQWIDKYHSSTTELVALQQSITESKMPEKITTYMSQNKHIPTDTQVKICDENFREYYLACPSNSKMNQYDFNRGWEYGFGSAIDQARLVEKRLQREIECVNKHLKEAGVIGYPRERPYQGVILLEAHRDSLQAKIGELDQFTTDKIAQLGAVMIENKHLKSLLSGDRLYQVIGNYFKTGFAVNIEKLIPINYDALVKAIQGEEGA